MLTLAYILQTAKMEYFIFLQFRDCGQTQRTFFITFDKYSKDHNFTVKGCQIIKFCKILEFWKICFKKQLFFHKFFGTSPVKVGEKKQLNYKVAFLTITPGLCKLPIYGTLIWSYPVGVSGLRKNCENYFFIFFQFRNSKQTNELFYKFRQALKGQRFYLQGLPDPQIFLHI